jgi:hypothetical protein
MSEPDQPPLVLTTNPRLSFALHGSGADLERAMEAVGPEQVKTWLLNRVGDEIDPADLDAALAAWFEAGSADDRFIARVELAELIGDADESTSELLWEASLRDGYERGDAELAFDAVANLARIAEESGDSLAAAEYFIEFLNWRRQDERVSDPEFVHQAFEEIVRLAEAERQVAIAARYEAAHAQFARLEAAGDDSAAEGDWSPGSPPYSGWE